MNKKNYSPRRCSIKIDSTEERREGEREREREVKEF